jgi:polyhydroxybutyrate depolymerase
MRYWLLFLAACGGSSMQTGDDDIHDDAAIPDDGSNGDDDAPVSATCAGKHTQPLDGTWSLTVGTLTRKANVHVPASYDPTKRTPLVINLHGRTSNATQQAWLSHANAKSDAAGFVVIHPEAWGSPTSWNAGGGCCDPAAANNIDDSGFVKAVLDKAEAELCVDTSRVYVMGLSNGGYLAHRMACELTDRIAATGAVAGLLQLSTCAPTRPMPVFLVHGTSDTLVSYDWVDETVDYWRITNHCTTMTTSYQNGAATCVTHGGCNGGADVVLCTIAGGGHQWPGGETVPFLGTKSDDVIATDALWDFFVAHPLP